MNVLVECVPNFSEGRDKAKVEAVVAEARNVDGVQILDVEIDADHHRCVLSFVGAPEAVLEACFRVARQCRESIDLNHHKGEHPRMGAVDVIPFIPVEGISIEDCAVLAEKLGERIGRELGIPVYLYDHAARRPERKDLAAVRKGQFEGLREEIGKNPDRAPDFGPARIHPTAGAVAVGARRQIINFNMNLDTADITSGKDIAKRVRATGGGLPNLRAKEIHLAARGQVQISTVLTDYKTTSIKKALDEVTRLAAEHGAKIKSTEIVGLLPREALLDFSLAELKLENFDPQVQILENRLEAVSGSERSMAPLGSELSPGAVSGSERSLDWRKAAETVDEALSTMDSTPGGGAAAGISGAMGCGLGQMAVGISLKSKKLDPAHRPELEEAHAAQGRFRLDFRRLTSEDAAAFDAFMAAAGLSKEDPQRPAKMQAALIRAAEVPLATAELAVEAYQSVVRVMPKTGAAVVSDMNCAAHLLKAAALCAAENVKINLSGIKDVRTAHNLKVRVNAATHLFTADPAIWLKK